MWVSVGQPGSHTETAWQNCLCYAILAGPTSRTRGDEGVGVRSGEVRWEQLFKGFKRLTVCLAWPDLPDEDMVSSVCQVGVIFVVPPLNSTEHHPSSLHSLTLLPCQPWVSPVSASPVQSPGSAGTPGRADHHQVSQFILLRAHLRLRNRQTCRREILLKVLC